MAINTDSAKGSTDASGRSYQQTVSSLKDSVVQATTGMEEAQTKISENMEKARKTAADALAFGQGTMEACIQSGQIWSAGLQDISKQFAMTSQASMEEVMNHFRALTSARSLKDAFEAHTNLMRASTEKMVSETGRLTTASIKLTHDAWAPITARMSSRVESVPKNV